MFGISGTQITLTRGDSMTAAIPMLVDDDIYELEEGDRCYFSAKADPTDDRPAIGPIKLDNYVLELDPNDTEGLDFGKYGYDAYIIFTDGRKLTYLTHSILILDKEDHT